MDADDRALTAHAASIPSMGGRKLAATLRKVAATAPPKTAIVEVGAWMGAGTAQLALGLRDAETHHTVALHTFDRWVASPSEALRAQQLGVAIRPGDDLLPPTQHALAPFDVPINFHQGEITDASWDDMPISVYVDDATKLPVAFLHVLLTFGPSWVPGLTKLVLMDFHHWRKVKWPLRELYRCQERFVLAHPANFVAWDGGPRRKGNLAAAAFRYTAPLDFDLVACNAALRRGATAERLLRRVTPRS